MQRPVPFGEVEDGNVEASIGGPVEGGGYVFLIAQQSAVEAIASRSIGDAVVLTDDARGGHVEGFEDRFRQEVAVEAPGDAGDQDAEKDVTAIRVAPGGSGREVEGLGSDGGDQLGIGVVEAEIEFAEAFVPDAVGVGEEVPHGDAAPGPGGWREVGGDGIVEPKEAAFG